MKKKYSLAIFLFVMLLSVSLISVASSQTVKTNIMYTKVNAAPSKPTVNIINPEQDEQILFGTYQITISALDSNGIKAVQLKINGPESTNKWVDITENLNEGYYTYNWDVGTEGSYSITARATNSDNRKADDNVGVTVAAAPPEPVHDVAVTGVSASPTSVEIGENVIVTVVVENQGDFTETFVVTSFYGSVPIGTQTVTGLVDGATSTLTFTWITTEVDEGEYTISAGASVVPDETDTADNTFTDSTVTVTTPGAPPTATYELFIEIDYIEGHAPTQLVLDYIKDYYLGNNPSGDLISVTFIVNDTIPYIDDYAGINDIEFSNIETDYNDHDNGYYSNWKWVLYGTTVEGEPNVIGYCYIEAIQVGRREADILAGNYMFIADETADVWATNNGIEPYGAEAAVLMHEMGHSIGIGILKYHPRGGWYEEYDSQSQSVMATLSKENAGLYVAWYYSNEYWATRNMEYYTIA